ncbi:MAG: universal stress protein, partial [Treponema sp.]|nr:universal stress protein [Treponema sp.]
MIKPLLRKLIVAVNGSEQSLSAAMYSIMLAMQYKCELKAVYVVDTATLKQLELSKFFVPDEVARYREKLHEDGQKYLD